MRFEYATRFARTLRRIPKHDQLRVAEAVGQLIVYCETHQAPEGLGLKKLFSRSELGVVFEARATLALRVLFSVYDDVVAFLMVGDHDEVRRFIRSFQ